MSQLRHDFEVKYQSKSNDVNLIRRHLKVEGGYDENRDIGKSGEPAPTEDGD